MDPIAGNINQIRALCQRYNVSELYVFGSVLLESFNEESDIDFIVDFSDVTIEEYAENYFNLKFSLEELFQRNIDLLENKAIRNPYLRDSIDSTKQQLYGA